jgi:hypothetical protein
VTQFKLVDREISPKIQWFDVNIMETEDESFTLGFSIDDGQFWVRNSREQIKMIDINLEAFKIRGAEIDEILTYLSHNL